MVPACSPHVSALPVCGAHARVTQVEDQRADLAMSDTELRAFLAEGPP